jgi:electron transfer flavoprotein beta subunit
LNTIVVCVKQVPATNDVKIDPVTKNLVRESVEGIMNPYDKNAVEEAVRIKERTGCNVIALSMGPPQYKESLREAIAMGCDDAILLSSRALGGADTLATAYTLSKGIEKIGGADLILFGRHAVDADTGQVGPITAEFLGLPQATFVTRLELEDDGWLTADRLSPAGAETVRVKLPAVVTVTGEINTPRYAVPIRIMKAARRDILVYNEQDLGCDPERIGIKGSRTVVTSVFTPPKPDRGTVMIEGSAEEAARRVAGILSDAGVL